MLPMRLSERIMLGSLILKPMAGIRKSGDGRFGCVFGMADETGHEFYKWTNEMPEVSVCLPCDCGRDGSAIMGNCCRKYPRSFCTRSYVQAIVHIFNYHVCTAKDWTLEQLVDWVRSVEPAEPEESESVAGVRKTDLRAESVSA